jgi:hydrogenase-4 component E
MMMTLNAIFVLVILINLFVLGAGRMKALIHAAALQGILLGLLPPLVLREAQFVPLFMALMTVVLKGVVIPNMLLKALRDAHVKREVEPIIGFMPCILLGAAATGAALVLAGRITPSASPLGLLVIPTSISMLFTGFLLLTTRVKALTQTIGFLLLENGIFVFGLLLLGAIPSLVELGVLLDLFVGIFVISIIMHHINREFASLDTRRLSSLKG